MTYIPTENHVVEGLARVPDQYKNKRFLTPFFAIYLHQAQLIHDAAEDTMAAFDLRSAVGFRLDWLGGLVGQSRRGSDDETYRTWIRAKIRANRSLGKAEDIRSICRLVLSDWHYSETVPGIRIQTSDPLTQEEALAIVAILQRAAPAGRKVFLFWGLEPAFGRAAAIRCVDGLETTTGGYDRVAPSSAGAGYYWHVAAGSDVL